MIPDEREKAMVELEIQDALWDDLVAVAQRRRTHPRALAEEVLRDFIQQTADEELLARSERAARRGRFRMEDTEDVVRKYRRRRAQS
jgi:hypothetical protein